MVSRLAWAQLHCILGVSEEARGKSRTASVFQASAYVTFASISFAKTCHMKGGGSRVEMQTTADRRAHSIALQGTGAWKDMINAHFSDFSDVWPLRLGERRQWQVQASRLSAQGVSNELHYP